MFILNKIKTPEDFDYQTYFKGLSPDDAYDRYKRLVSKYYRVFNDMKRSELARELRRDAPNYKSEKFLLRKLYEKANMLEKYVRYNSPKKYAFVDLGSLGFGEHMQEDCTDYGFPCNSSNNNIKRILWMPSSEFLNLAYPLKTGGLDDRDLQSIGYSYNRLNNGRVMPPSLQFAENDDGEMYTKYHQGRHRNIANLMNDAEGELPVLVSFPANKLKWFRRMHRAVREGNPLGYVVNPQGASKDDIEGVLEDRFINTDERLAEALEDNGEVYDSVSNVIPLYRPRGMSPKKFKNRVKMSNSPSYYTMGNQASPEDIDTALDPNMEEKFKQYMNNQ